MRSRSRSWRPGPRRSPGCRRGSPRPGRAGRAGRSPRRSRRRPRRRASADPLDDSPRISRITAVTAAVIRQNGCPAGSASTRDVCAAACRRVAPIAMAAASATSRSSTRTSKCRYCGRSPSGQVGRPVAVDPGEGQARPVGRVADDDPVALVLHPLHAQQLLVERGQRVRVGAVDDDAVQLSDHLPPLEPKASLPSSSDQSSSSDVRLDLDLDQVVGIGQCADRDHGGDRRMVAEQLAMGAADLGLVGRCR